MKFDILRRASCVVPGRNGVVCAILPGEDEVPGVQPQEPTLVLRPEFATIAVMGSVQYRTYLVANGVETEITNGLTYVDSDQSVALIGAIGGNATGVHEGITTVTVTWQGMTAYGQLTVVESCDASTVGTVVLIDRSASMAQEFGGQWSTKLLLAKLMAKKFVGETNVQKGDRAALMAFSTTTSKIRDMTDDVVLLASDIMALQTDTEKTDLQAAILTASSYLADQAFDRRVILLFSDGYKTIGGNAVTVANSFRAAGGIVIVVGLRDGLPAFELLQQVANGGFFLSAYDVATAVQAMHDLSGLKGYYCAGNCVEPGGAVISKGELNFDRFINWDVVDGKLDLIGLGFYDFLPGNGLYVDLAGSSPNYRGRLASKQDFQTIAGHVYKLSYRLAGNQRIDVPTFRVAVEFGSIVQVQRDVNDWRQDFATYEDSFTGDGTAGKISFQMTLWSAVDESFGVLLDEIKLVDVTDGTTIFYDNFDGDNAEFIPPACGTVVLSFEETVASGVLSRKLLSDDGNWYLMTLDTSGGITSAQYGQTPVSAPADTTPLVLPSNDATWHVVSLQTQMGSTGGYIDPNPTTAPTDQSPFVLTSTNGLNYQVDLDTIEGFTSVHPAQDPYGTVMVSVMVDVPYTGLDCYGYGCLKEPIRAQSPDPNPPPNLETGIDPMSWTATECHTETCEVAPFGSVEKCVTYKSFLSADDAHTQALRLAILQAVAALQCLRPIGVHELVSIDFDESSRVSDGMSRKTGKAAFGLTPDDYWNLAKTIEGSQLTNSAGLFTNVAFFYGVPFAALVKTPDTVDFPDRMFEQAVQHLRTGAESDDVQFALVLAGLAAGTYDLYLYGHGSDDDTTGRYEVVVGTLETDQTITVATNYGIKTTINGPTYRVPPSWSEFHQYVVFNITVAAGQAVGIMGHLDGSGTSVINGLQLYRVT